MIDSCWLLLLPTNSLSSSFVSSFSSSQAPFDLRWLCWLSLAGYISSLQLRLCFYSSTLATSIWCDCSAMVRTPFDQWICCPSLTRVDRLESLNSCWILSLGSFDFRWPCWLAVTTVLQLQLPLISPLSPPVDRWFTLTNVDYCWLLLTIVDCLLNVIWVKESERRSERGGGQGKERSTVCKFLLYSLDIVACRWLVCGLIAYICLAAVFCKPSLTFVDSPRTILTI